MFKKHAIIIGGLAASGKSSFAKLFKKLGYFLIDDPIDPSIPQDLLIKHSKIVITSPFLTISKHREDVKAELKKAKFKVTSFVLDVQIEECSKRAKKLNKKVDGLNRYLLKKSA